MKKLLTIGLAAAMTFAVASQVKAAVPLETAAELRVRLFYLDSYAGAVAKNGATNEFWDQRLRLNMNWPVAENVKLQVRADILEGFWGDNSISTGFTVAEAADGVHTVTPTSSGVAGKVPIDFDWANMVFTWPGTPLTFTVGRQDASWGPGIFSKSDPRDRFKVVGAFDFGTLIAGYQKRKEVFNSHDTNSVDDDRQYLAGYIGKAAGWTFGIVGVDTIYETNPAVDTQHFIFDGYATGKAGPADLSFEAFYLTGKSDYNDPAKHDLDLSAIGLYGGAFVPAGPVTIGFEGAYDSGNDPSTPNKNEGALAFDYHSPFWSVVLFNNMDLPGYAGESVPTSTSLSNAWAAKLTVVAKPAPGLTVVGAAVYAARLQDVVNADKSITKADPLGPEFDLIFIYAITPNVNWTVGAGYLIPGDFYTSGGRKADNALAATSQFVLKF
jgi:hypothetical protein